MGSNTYYSLDNEGVSTPRAVSIGSADPSAPGTPCTPRAVPARQHRVVGQQVEHALLRRAEAERRRLAHHPLWMPSGGYGGSSMSLHRLVGWRINLPERHLPVRPCPSRCSSE